MSSFASTVKRMKCNWLRQLFANGRVVERVAPLRPMGSRMLEILEERRLLAVFPEIDIRGNAQSIPDGDSTPALTDHTNFGSADINSGTINRTFTVANTGAGVLNLTAATRVKISGTHASDFKVTTQPTATVAASTGTTTFVVRFDPSATGARNATITVYNDDDNENPYTFDITGTGTTAPEVDVTGNSLSILDNDTTPSTTDHTDFGNVEATAGTFSRTFTIKNTGSGTLTLTDTAGEYVVVSGANAVDFTVTTDAPATIAAGATATFTVEFDPGATGARSATLTILTDDLNEGTYNFNIKGTGVNQPEMNVTGNSVNIEDGDLVAGDDGDDTGFGSIEVVGATQTRTFTIQNLGSATLNLTGAPIARITGAHAADFSVTTQPAAASIASGGGDVTFVVTFNPSAAGARNAVVSILNNDGNESPYDFAITGTGTTTSEIEVRDPDDTNITTGDATPDGDRVFGNAEVAFGTVTRTFTIKNTGSIAMVLGASPVSLTGTDPGEFSITQPGITTIPVGGQTTFTVTFDPTAAGAKTATVNVANDDPDGGESPFTFDVTGTGTTASEMDVRGNSTSIAHNDTTPTTTDHSDFGGADITSGTVVRTFTIHNLGSAALDLDDTTPITVTGTGFALTSGPSVDPIPAGSTATFTVTFDPSDPGLHTGSISIDGDDADEDPYTFSIQGTGTANVEVEISGNGTAIADNDDSPDSADHTSFGSAQIGTTTVTRTFTMTNSGSDALNLTGSPLIEITGTHAGDFAVTAVPDTSVAGGGGTTTFQVTFDPRAAGVRKATITVMNDDSNEGTYTFDITGTGVAVPEIELSGGGLVIDSGDTAPTTGDGTDFGTVETTAGSITKTFTITNLGSGLLTLSGTPLVAIDDATHFTVVQPANAMLQPNGGSVTFQVIFDPTSAGAKTATLTIASDDASEASYTFDITGTGADNPEIDVFGNGQEIVDGDSAPTAFDGTHFGSVEVATGVVKHTFTIKNTGSSNLILSGTPAVALSGDTGDFSITAQPATPIAAGDEETFEIVFNPSSAGVKTLTITIDNDDPDAGEATYTFVLEGVGVTAPEIDILGNSISIADGDTTPRLADLSDFGTADIGGGTVTRTFTVKNTGSGALTFNGTTPITISGTDADLFAVVAQPTSTVASGGGTTTFQVIFTPDTVGTKKATISIASDDLDEDVYTFDIAGSGITDPNIEVSGASNGITSGDTTPTTTDDTDFGGTDLTNGSVVKTFTITNSGSADLIKAENASDFISISGAHASDFTITTDPTLPVVASGGTTTFQITFNPSGAGTRTATITIASNDPDSGTFTFNVEGSGLVTPEIGILSPTGLALTDNAAASSANGTDFGSVDTASGVVTKTFTVQNTGSGVLRLTGPNQAVPVAKVAISGAGAADYSITQEPATRIAALTGTTTFKVTFDPSGAAGARPAILTIYNNDSDEGTFEINLTGAAVLASEMDVQGNSTSITDGDGTPSSADHTDFGTADVATGSVIRTFTVKNAGAGALNFTGTPRVVIGGTNAADFTVTANLPASVTATDGASGGTDETTFQVTFNPAAAGVRTATISIANNDSDENPYNFTVQGTGTTVAEIDVKGNGVSIIGDGTNTPGGGDDTDFGSTEINTGTVTKTFTIANTGSASLSITGSPLVQVGGTDAADFTVVTLPATTVAATTGTTTFQVRFNPSSVGTKNASLTITNTDPNESTYVFNIQGTGATAPEAEVLGNSNIISDGDTSASTTDHTDFGSVTINGGTQTRTFTIRNTGSGPLDLTGSLVTVTANGANPGSGEFTVTTLPASDPVTANNGTTTFVVTFAPTASGTRSAVVNVHSDDSDEATYNFVVQGVGTTGPEIDVRQGATSIPDNSTATPPDADVRDFGDADIAGGTVSKTFAIHNTGSTALSISGTTRVVISGVNAADFTVTTQPSASVAAGANSSFIILFNPSASGTRIATVTVTSNDANEGTYNFTIKGNGTTAPDIDVQGNGVSIADGDATPASADHTNFGTVEVNQGTVTRTFTVRNTGSDALNLTGSPRVDITGANAADFVVKTNARSSIGASGSTTFDIEFTPSGTGAHTATVTIVNDDPDAAEQSYSFSIEGTGANLPEIAISGNGTNIANGDTTPATTDHTNFGTVTTAGSGTIVRTFTITNPGSDTLNISGTPKVAISGTHASDFTVTQVPNGTVASGGGTTTFKITFNPSATGTRTAIVTIANNDPDEAPFVFHIRGSGA